jgi:hypothetical protein
MKYRIVEDRENRTETLWCIQSKAGWFSRWRHCTFRRSLEEAIAAVPPKQVVWESK